MVIRKPISRRTLLRGAGHIAIALPFLDVMESQGALAQGGSVPKRFGYFQWAHGVMAKHFDPPGGGTTLGTMNIVLKSLEKHAKDMNLITGLTQSGDSFSHNNGLTALTGLANGAGPARTKAEGLGTSVDQMFAKLQKTKVSSLELGCGNSGNNDVNRPHNWIAKGQPLLPQTNPKVIFDKLFNGFNADPAAAEDVRARRKSILDSVIANYKTFEQSVSSEDRRRLDSHMTSIREMEQALSDIPGNGGGAQGCTIPSGQFAGANSIPVIMKLQMDLIASAFICDITRVVTFLMSSSGLSAGGHRNHTWVTNGAGHWHDAAHMEGRFSTGDTVTAVAAWHYEQIAYLADKLAAAREGGRTVLQNSLLLVTPEYGGNEPNHTHSNMRYVLLGSQGGMLKTGRHLKYGASNYHSQILTSIARTFGIQETIGSAKYGGELPGLLG